MILTHPVLYRNIMQNTFGRFLINSTDSPREATSVCQADYNEKIPSVSEYIHTLISQAQGRIKPGDFMLDLKKKKRK